VERIQHLEDRLFDVFLYRDSGAESFALGGSVKNDRYQFALVGTLIERVVNFPHHGDVENIEWRARERYARGAVLDPELDVLIPGWHVKLGFFLGTCST
jgi:hypothetical protein